MAALHRNGTWELTTLPTGKEAIGCHWVYTIKYHLHGTIEKLEAWLVTKGYKLLVWIILKHSLQLSDLIQLGFLYLWLPHYTALISIKCKKCLLQW